MNKLKKNLKLVIFKNLLIGVFVLFFSLLVASFLEFWQFVRPEKSKNLQTPQNYASSHEDIQLTTSDGLKLSGWYVPKEGDKTNSAIVILHGYGASKGDVLEWVPFLHDDYNLLLFDFRYFGESEGKFTSFGFHERKDLESAVRFLKDKEIEKIGILSFSMGASIALYSADTIEVDAIVAESPYASVDLMAQDAYKNFSYLKYPVILFTNIVGKIIIGATTYEISSEKAIAKDDTPVFLIYSSGDELIPPLHFERLKQVIVNNPRSDYWSVDSAPHGAIYFTYKDEYQKRISEFFSKNLENKEHGGGYLKKL